MSEKMKRREFLPLAGAGAIMAPTILSSCSTSTGPGKLSIPGTIAFERDTAYEGGDRDVWIMDWTTETQINLTADIPGSHGRPYWSQDGTALYFDSVVDGKSFIQKMNDLTDPVGSLEVIVNEAGHQLYPIVHPDGNLLVYSQMDSLNVLSSSSIVAYDMSLGQEISRTEENVVRVINNNNPNDRAFIPGERNVICTGVPSVGIFNSDTGEIEPYEFDDTHHSNISIHSVAITSDGLTAYGLGQTNFDRILRWNTQPGSRYIETLDSTQGGKIRMLADLIESPEETVMLSGCRLGYVSSTSYWKIGYTDVSKPGNRSGQRFSTASFNNMTGSNYYPRHTFTEHI